MNAPQHIATAKQARPAPRPATSPWRRQLAPGSWLIYALGLTPGAWTFYLGLTDQLGADPLKVLERSLGLWALRFLVIGLAITPIRRIGGPNLVRWRRTAGLLAFCYALFHVIVYIWLDQGLDVGLIWKDIVKRPYITVGLAAFLILIPLAATSNTTMIKRMGAAAWQRLHRWVYVAAAAGALHFIMLVKAWPPEPLVYAALVTGLLLFRLADHYLRAKRTPRF